MAMKERRGANWQGGRCSNAPGTSGWGRNVAISQSGLRIATMHYDGDKGIDYVMDEIEEGSEKCRNEPGTNSRHAAYM